jgi:hypothetical protein
MRVLGIETSCDETGVAVYDSHAGLLGHRLHSQAATHAEYGGVVPELASRDHVRKLIPLIDALLDDADLARADIEGVAYTAGPGLVGALLVGAAVGRSLAFALGVPSVAVHHMEGHLLAPMLEPDPPAFPFLASWSPSTPSAPTACSASLSTMPPAKPSTRPRACWDCPIPAAPSSPRWPKPGVRHAFASPAR